MLDIDMLSVYLLAAGALGTALRFAILEIFRPYVRSDFPWTTLLINVFGCFVAGFLYAYFVRLQTQWNTVIMVGFLGAFTTFASYILDLFRMLKHGQYIRAVLYISLQNLFGLLFLFFGFFLMKRMVQ